MNKKNYLFFFILIFFIFNFKILNAETKQAINLPDISFIGRAGLNLYANDEGEKFAKLGLDGIEINATGYMHPDIRADFVIGAHKHENEINFDIEEAFITFSNLPLSTGAKLGKKLLDFGRINHIHQHEWLFLSKPLIYENYLGEHSLSGEGGAIDLLLPLPFFLNLQVGLWKNEQIHSENADCHHIEFFPAGELYNLRLWTSFELQEKSELEFGLSGIKGQGSHYQHHIDRIEMAGVDLTFKLWPEAYSRLMILAEAMYLKREVPIGIFESWGIYIYSGYRFDKNWETGIRYDWAETPGPDKSKSSGVSFVQSYYVTEELKLRGEYIFTPEEKSHKGFLKVIYGIGPHTHPLQ